MLGCLPLGAPCSPCGCGERRGLRGLPPSSPDLRRTGRGDTSPGSLCSFGCRCGFRYKRVGFPWWLPLRIVKPRAPQTPTHLAGALPRMWTKALSAHTQSFQKAALSGGWKSGNARRLEGRGRRAGRLGCGGRQERGCVENRMLHCCREGGKDGQKDGRKERRGMFQPRTAHRSRGGAADLEGAVAVRAPHPRAVGSPPFY